MNNLDTQRVTVSDGGTALPGPWMVCRLCDSSWRPGERSEHEEGCPAAEFEGVRGPTAEETHEREQRAADAWNGIGNGQTYEDT